jgi:hypothetical protein
MFTRQCYSRHMFKNEKRKYQNEMKIDWNSLFVCYLLVSDFYHRSVFTVVKNFICEKENKKFHKRFSESNHVLNTVYVRDAFPHHNYESYSHDVQPLFQFFFIFIISSFFSQHLSIHPFATCL